MWEGGEFIATTMMMMTTMMMATRDAQQLHRVKKHILCLIFFNSPCATEAARRHTKPSNIDIIIMHYVSR